MAGLQGSRARNLWALFAVGIVSATLYAIGARAVPFRPDRIQLFLVPFGLLFVAYLIVVWLVLKTPLGVNSLLFIFAGAAIFNLILLPTLPSLSDDMFRYIWDGRVQGNGINPYRYPSNAAELTNLRDAQIWAHMNRPAATTLYPPGAQLVFAAWWRVVGDSIFAFKALFVSCIVVCGALLVQLLKSVGEAPAKVLIFLWNPLLIFEIAHSGHVDALYLPFVVGALLARAVSPPYRADWRYEALIGILLGLAILSKLYPAILFVPLWAVRDCQGRRHWRLALPLMAVLVTAAGYALYIAPGVDTLGFLSKYTQEFFNIGPIPLTIIHWTEGQHWNWYTIVSALTLVFIALVSLYFVLFPARTNSQAIQRCIYPISIYFLLSYNLFSWYVLWLLPFIALDLGSVNRQPSWLKVQAFAWLLFTGLVALSYTTFITGYPDLMWINIEFIPVYVLLIIALALFVRHQVLRWQTARHSA
jgi:alpha-1,6-mannosyltransferase